MKTWSHDTVGVLQLAASGEPVAFALSPAAEKQIARASGVVLRLSGVRADTGARIERDAVAGGFAPGPVQLWASPAKVVIRFDQMNLPAGAYWAALELQLIGGDAWPLGGVRLQVSA